MKSQYRARLGYIEVSSRYPYTYELKKHQCDNNNMNMQMLESRLASGEQDDSHRCGRVGKGEGGEEAETFFTRFASNFFKGFPYIFQRRRRSRSIFSSKFRLRGIPIIFQSQSIFCRFYLQVCFKFFQILFNGVEEVTTFFTTCSKFVHR